MPFLPFIPFADCVDVFFDFIQQGVPWAVTMGVRSTTPVDALRLLNLNTVLDTWWTDDMRQNVSGNVNLRNIKLTDLTSETGPTLTTAPTNTAGTLTGSVLPAQTAMVVTLNTALRGRSYRGRNYWAGRVFADQDTVTQWGATRLNAIASAYDALFALLNTDGWSMVVLSRQNAGVRRTVGVATTVTVALTKPNIGTQRRRLL